MGTTRGLAKVNPDLGRNRIEVESTFTDRDGLADNLVKALLRTSDGSLWVGTRSGLARFDAGAGAGQKRFRSFGVSNGLVYGNIEFLSEDSRGNVWVATDGGGAARIAPGGFSTFNQSDGFSPGYVGATALDQKGRPLILTSANGNLVVHRFDGHRFTSIELAAPEGFHPRAWIPWHQIVLESKSGYWWSTSHGGLVRYSAPGESPPRVLEPDRIFRIEDGLPDNEVGNIFEDSRGNLWIGTLAGGFAYPKFGAKAGLSMLPSGGRVMRHFSEADGLPPLDSIKIVSVFEDRSGQVWIGMHRTGVARYRNGRFQVFTTGDGVPNGGIRQFHQDGAGHLWLASTSGGLGRVQDPGADRLTITNFTTSDGLSSDEIQTITSDQLGRIYAGTGLGVDRLDPARGQVLHLTAADGLAPGEVQDSIRDSSGNLWFGTLTGISRLSPHLDLPQRPENVLIASVRVAGQSHPLASSGVQDAGLPSVALPDLQPEESNVEIDFVGPPGVTGLRYQHRLEGADREWSPSSQLGTVSYSHLRDGAYRFLVRSVTAEGIVGSPASVSFAVLPPVWQRWWFLLSAALLTAAGVRIVYRNRVAHLLEIERMRTRIACDLHDDVGSSLSKIAILSEVAKRAGHGGAASPALERIAETSREVLESVGDLVWAINTRTGRLEDLIRRMRVFATQVFEAKDVEFQFEAIDVPLQKTITPEVLRQVYLIFKEAVNNAARHSHCTRSAVSLKGGYSSLTLIVSDNGTGFTPSQGHDQHGIESLRARASALKGEISWTFDGGTQVTLSLPLPK